MNTLKKFIASINLKEVQPHTYVSIVMVILVIVNQCLTLMGRPLIQFEETTITFCVNTILNLIGILYPAWKNQSFSIIAQYADTILYMLRDGKITIEELEEFIQKYEKEDTK